MNKKGDVASKAAFYIMYLLLFTLTVGYALRFVEGNEVRQIDFMDLEKSVLINRALSCLSNGNFGEIDRNKFNEEVMSKCLNSNRFSFLIILDEGQIGESDSVSLGGSVGGDSIGVSRMVLVDGNNARLNLYYKKNAA